MRSWVHGSGLSRSKLKDTAGAAAAGVVVCHCCCGGRYIDWTSDELSYGSYEE